MGLRDIGATLPPGFRFYPSDEELVCHYLYKKIANEEVLKGTLVEIDLHTCEPWQLPEVAKLNTSEWYFFSFRDRKYATGFRTNRATTSGYWKATGKDRTVMDPRSQAIVGMRKTLVFYRNRAPNGVKTGWIMHEFRLENPHIPPKEDWVLCRVFHKSKGETSENNNLNTCMYDNSIVLPAATSPPSLAASPPNMDAASFPYRPIAAAAACQNQTATTAAAANFFNVSLSVPEHHHNGFLRSSHEMPHSNKCETDQYGFLFDMNFEEPNFHDGGVHSSLDDMRFDDENSMVFI
nr:NAC domain-containing protein 21/22-like [Ipomoea batatas]